jgi:hypothetical protein
MRVVAAAESTTSRDVNALTYPTRASAGHSELHKTIIERSAITDSAVNKGVRA